MVDGKDIRRKKTISWEMLWALHTDVNVHELGETQSIKESYSECAEKYVTTKDTEDIEDVK